jgi:hypothetical protein
VLAQGWRRGHLLLCGNAAHQGRPFLGQRICAPAFAMPPISPGDGAAWEAGRTASQQLLGLASPAFLASGVIYVCVEKHVVLWFNNTSTDEGLIAA